MKLTVDLKFSAVMLTAIFMFSCNPEKEYKKIHGDIQGTTYNITYEDKVGRDLHPEIKNLLHEFDLSLSSYNSESIISKVNRNEPVELDKFFITVFKKSDEVYRLSDGAFDITVGPLANVWGFGPEQRINVDSAYIDSIRQYVGMDKISISDGKVVKKYQEMQINVNAIAQGYSVDVVGDFLNSKGIKNYMVEIGGELKTKGLNPKGESWKIGIDKPVDNNMIPGQNLQAVVQLNNKSLATSGNYRKLFIKDGIKYSHSINPKTGYPIMSKLLSATVMTDDCISADAFATAFMVMGLERSIDFVNRQDKLDVYFVYSDDQGNFRTFETPGMKKCILEEVQ